MRHCGLSNGPGNYKNRQGIAFRGKLIVAAVIFLALLSICILCDVSGHLLALHAHQDALIILGQNEEYVYGIEKNTLSPVAECHICASGGACFTGETTPIPSWCAEAAQEIFGLVSVSVRAVALQSKELLESCRPILQLKREGLLGKFKYTAFFPRWETWSGPPPSWNRLQPTELPLESKNECSKTLYLTVAVGGGGNHHNQLQQMMNGLVLARKLKRTFVLPAFERQAYIDPEYLYNFSALQRAGYCIINAKEFHRHLSMRHDTLTMRSYSGDNIRDHFPELLKRRVDMMPILGYDYPRDPTLSNATLYFTHLSCRPTGVKDCDYQFVTLYAFEGKDELLRSTDMMDETLTVVSSGTAFVAKPTVSEMARIYGLLQPSFHIALDMKNYIKSIGLENSDEPLPISAFHIRLREKTCERELVLKDGVSDSAVHLMGLRNGNVSHMLSDCYWTPNFIQQVNERFYDDSTRHQLPALRGTYLAHDKEGAQLSKEVTRRTQINSAHLSTGTVSRQQQVFSRPGDTPVPYYSAESQTLELNTTHCWPEGAISSLHSLTVDYFVLTRSRYFRGNVLSSVSQNTCFRRLGNGLPCHGVFPGYYLAMFQGESISIQRD